MTASEKKIIQNSEAYFDPLHQNTLFLLGQSCTESFFMI